MKQILDQIKKTIFFLGTIGDNGQIQANATAFLVLANNYTHLVTAKHVIVDPENNSFIDQGLMAFSNTKGGEIRPTSLDHLKSNFGFKWVFHQNKDVDVAMIPFPIRPQEDDVKFVSNDLFLTSNQLYEVYDVFFLSYQQ